MMSLKFKSLPLLLFCFSFLISCGGSKPVVKTKTPPPVETPKETLPVVAAEEPDSLSGEPVLSKEKIEEPIEKYPDRPFPPREFRAAWVATVANINWPSKPGLSSLEQQKEAIALLDLLKKNNFNAVIFQVRPQADAFYQSDLEPWSYFLTGEQGKAPEPWYDPLQFWIEAAHDRGLELHAWLNPYRAQHSSGKEISEHSIIKTNPELVVQLENGMYWMDPSKEGTQAHSTAVVMDILKRYDVDGIHFDDYFYPYESYNGGREFPDDQSWAAYLQSGGKLSRGDWRRESVNSFIRNIYGKIKEVKPEVKFGVSPFGIWRPGFPETIAGFDQYDKLYADARLWLNEGWVDYFTPQLYWKINQTAQSFPVLLGWWSGENHKQRHLWPGISAGLGGDERNEDEVINQIMISRGMLPESPGVVFWSIAPLVQFPNLGKAILEGPYKKEALVPRSPWLDNIPPAPPVVITEHNGETLKFSWLPGDDQEVFKWVVYFKHGDYWNYRILNRGVSSFNVSKSVGEEAVLEAVVITAIDRSGNESRFREISSDLL